MIVEFPRPTRVASPFKRLKIALARQKFLNNCGAVASSSWLTLSGSITIFGVGLTGVDQVRVQNLPHLQVDGVSSFEPGSRGTT